MENKKCTDFKKYFTSDNEEEFKLHIQNCPDCRLEFERMEKVSNLIKEVAPIIKRREKRRVQRFKVMSLAASIVVTLFTFFTIQIMNPNSLINETIAYMKADCTYEQMGLPVDEMGFIMVDFEE